MPGARVLFSFTGWDNDHPGQRPPGDRLDAQFQELIRANLELSSRIDTLLRSDGRLRNGLVSRETLAADLAEDLAARFRDEIAPDLTTASANARVAEASSIAASTSRDAAVQASSGAATSLASVQSLRDRAVHALEELQDEIDTRLRALRDANVDALDAVNDAEGFANLAFKYCELAGAWAEHMPDPIPPTTLAVMGITGDHWSSRWWANQAAAAAGGGLSWFFLGAYDHDHAPTSTPTGQPLQPGMMYFDTTLNQMMVWNGTAWQSTGAPQPGITASYFYVATAGQTIFPLSVPDKFGHTGTISVGQAVQVHLNGVMLTPTDDYVMDQPTSRVTLTSGAPAGLIVAIDLMVLANQLAHGVALGRKLAALSPVPDGTNKVFTLASADAAAFAVSDTAQVLISINGVWQDPAAAYTISAATITFADAPEADAAVFGVWFSPT